MSRIIAKHSCYIVEDVLEVPKKLEYELATWNNVYFKVEYIGMYYDKDKKELRVPRGYPDINLQRYFPTHKFEIDKDGFYPYDKIQINLTTPPRDYIQRHALTYMIGKPPYEYVTAHSQTYVDLDTGEGKTYCGIATICYFQCGGVIFTPTTNSKIGDQWKTACSKFTTLKSNEVLLVKGSKICEDIIKGKYKHVKIFIIPRSTVSSFVRKYDDNWQVLETLVKAMNAGVKIVDEAHMDFSTLVKIECHTNVKRNYYMSSSPSRSKREEKAIYRKVFYDVPKHGKKLKTVEQNHIIMMTIGFKSEPSREWEKKIRTKFGPSQAKYGEYLLADDGAREEFIDAYAYAIYFLIRYRRFGGKLLVVTITNDAARELAEITKDLFPEYSIGLYIGSGKDKDKELDNDIIISNPKSMGTGAEIENHQLTINTITYASDVMSDQLPGRNRKDERRKSMYLELVNMSHPVAKKHYKEREEFLKKKAKDGKLLYLELKHNDLLELDKFFAKKYHYDEDGRLCDKNGHYVIGRRKK